MDTDGLCSGPFRSLGWPSLGLVCLATNGDPAWRFSALLSWCSSGRLLLANERWGSVPKHRANCERWRERYEQATTMIDLERARDGLRERGCSINEG